MAALKERPPHDGNRGGVSIHSAAGSTAPMDRLLLRLSGVKQTGPGRYIARCPAHPDRHPSLNVREKEDGTLLLQCRAGCGAADVMAAAGLTLAALFPGKPYNRAPLGPRERWIPGDVWQCVAFGAEIAAVAAAEIALGNPLSPDDAARVALAADRLAAACQSLGVTR